MESLLILPPPEELTLLVSICATGLFTTADPDSSEKKQRIDVLEFVKLALSV